MHATISCNRTAPTYQGTMHGMGSGTISVTKEVTKKRPRRMFKPTENRNLNLPPKCWSKLKPCHSLRTFVYDLYSIHTSPPIVKRWVPELELGFFGRGGWIELLSRLPPPHREKGGKFWVVQPPLPPKTFYRGNSRNLGLIPPCDLRTKYEQNFLGPSPLSS